MIVLNELQTNKIADYLSKSKLNTEIKDELLDHLCCEVEQLMQDGYSFDQSYARTIRQWPTKNLSAINKRIQFTTKTKPMLYRITALAALVASFFLLVPLAPAPTVDVACVEIEQESALTDFDPPTASPLKGVTLADVTSHFGMRIHPITKQKVLHKGVDFRAKAGTAVMATADGEVVFAGLNGKHGIQVVINHDEGYSTIYNHLQSHQVEVGQNVVLGQTIAKVGTTGMSTGPHLHYEVRKNNLPINPLAALE